KFGKHFAEHFDRALHVGLDHHAQFLNFTRLQLFVQLVESDTSAGAGTKLRVALLALTIIHDMARFGFVGHLEMIASFGNTLQAEHFDGSGWRSFLDGAAVLVKESAHFAENRAADEEISGAERAVLNENSG